MAIKWGVMGTANVADWGVIPGMLQAKDCELYAIAGRYEEKVNAYKEKFGFEKGYVGYDALLTDKAVQAVYIPLPNNLHKEWVIKALQAGKHVLCEKPLALNAAEAEEMYRVAEANGVILAEAYAYLHSPYVKSVRDAVKSGVLGEIFYLETAFVTQGYEEDIRLYKELGGGAMYDLGCYCTTMIGTLIDGETEYVKATTEVNEHGADLFTAGIIKFKSGARASFNVGMMLGTATNARFDRLYVHGTKGILRSDVEYNQAGTLSYTITVDGETTTHTVEVRNNYSLEIEQMNRAIMGEEEIYVTKEFSIRNAKMIDGALASMGY